MGRGRIPIRYCVNDRLMTVRDIAEALGVPESTLRACRYTRVNADGTPISWQKIYELYRTRRRQYDGRPPGRYPCAGEQLTIREAAGRLRVSELTVRTYMRNHRCDLDAAFRGIDARETRRAERAILAVLREAKHRRAARDDVRRRAACER